MGAGNKDLLTADKLRSLIAQALRQAARMKAKQIFLFPGFIGPVNDVAFGHVLAETALLVSYRFGKYQSSERQSTEMESLHYVLNTKKPGI